MMDLGSLFILGLIIKLIDGVLKGFRIYDLLKNVSR